MSRLRVVRSALLVGALVVVAAGCSDDGEPEARSDRREFSFSVAPPGSNDLGLCRAYLTEDIKDLIGGEQSFRRLPPEAIGSEGDAVTGEVCAWERNEANGDLLALRIEVRDFGDDVAALDEQFAALEEGTIDATPLDGVGDDAFSSVSPETSLVQIRSGSYLLTASSRSAGELEPVELDVMRLLGAAGLAQLP